MNTWNESQSIMMRYRTARYTHNNRGIVGTYRTKAYVASFRRTWHIRSQPFRINLLCYSFQSITFRDSSRK